jgi:hypothetical protein
MSRPIQLPLDETQVQHRRTQDIEHTGQFTCPICGAMTQDRQMGDKTGWVCLAGGYAHYYQARYGHLERWFTSGEGNLREPVIQAMNCAA